MALNVFFEKIATPYVAILSLLILIGSTYILGRLNPYKEIKEAKLPYLSVGTSFGYRSQALYDMLTGFNSSEGQPFKERYRRFLYFDLIYPWFYGLSGALLLAFYQRSVNSTELSVRYLWVIPILAGIFDNAENISLLYLLGSYNKEAMPLAVGFSRLMTMLKLIFIYASLFLIILSIIELIKLPFKGSGVRQPTG